MQEAATQAYGSVDMTTQGIQDMTTQAMQDMTTQAMQDMTTQGMQDMTTQAYGPGMIVDEEDASGSGQDSDGGEEPTQVHVLCVILIFFSYFNAPSLYIL